MGERVCTSCDVLKSDSEYYTTKGAIRQPCKPCHVTRSKGKLAEWRKLNPDKVKLQNDRRKAARHAWYKSVKDNEGFLARQKETYLRNYASSRERRLEAKHRRRARQRDAYVENVRRSVLFERDGGMCGICKTKLYLEDCHIDHIIPLAKGGLHSYANTQLAHPKCNFKKNDSMPGDYQCPF